MNSSKYAIAKLQARMDGKVRAERRDELKCEPGNKPCGKRCIPQAQKCAVDGAGGNTGKKIAAFAAAGVAGGAIGFSALKIGQAVAERRKKAQVEAAEPDAISARKVGNNVQEDAPDEAMKSAAPKYNKPRGNSKPRGNNSAKAPSSSSPKASEEKAGSSSDNSPEEKKKKPGIVSRFRDGLKSAFKKKEKPAKSSTPAKVSSPTRSSSPMKSANIDSTFRRFDSFSRERLVSL